MKNDHPKTAEDVMYEKGREILILGLRVIRPSISDQGAENLIINVANYIQLKRLEDKKII